MYIYVYIYILYIYTHTCSGQFPFKPCGCALVDAWVGLLDDDKPSLQVFLGDCFACKLVRI